MSSLATTVQQLQQRVERLEGHQARLHNEVTAQLRRADLAVEDLVAALEVLRGRIEALEPAEVRSGP
jgi:seryl-tRNA synthetase